MLVDVQDEIDDKLKIFHYDSNFATTNANKRNSITLRHTLIIYMYGALPFSAAKLGIYGEQPNKNAPKRNDWNLF